MAKEAMMNSVTGSQAVAENLKNADKVQDLSGEVHAATEVAGGPTDHHVEPKALGMDSTMWVSLAMVVLIVLLLVKKVPAAIGKALDGRIADIRNQLDEASKLRAEAEELKAEYQAKLAGAEKDAIAMRARAEEEAALLIADARVSAADLIERRQKMAEDKIAAAERTAIADIRARAVGAATAAATTLIAQHHDAAADKVMIDGAIKSLETIN